MYVVVVVAGLVIGFVDDTGLSPLVPLLNVWGILRLGPQHQPAAGARELAACERLELVEACGRPFDPDLHVRTADGTRLAWPVTDGAVPRRGPLWATAPVVAGHRLTVVFPQGRSGVRFVGAVRAAATAPDVVGERRP